jgi:hypothetical protein
MEPLWSPVVPTGGNQRQRRGPQTAKTTEIRCAGCDRLHETFHGKEGVDGSSPSEGFTKRPANGLFRCLDGLRTSLGSASLNLSPGSVPNIARGLEAWLKQRRPTFIEHLHEREVPRNRRSQRNRRVGHPPLDGVKPADVGRFALSTGS